MAFLMDITLIDIVMNDRILDEIHSNYWNKAWYILYPNVFEMKCYDGWLKVGMTNLLLSDSNCNNVDL